jgi:hypothetical protein
MPTQTIKDPQTGEERQVYVAPKGMAKQPTQRPAAKPRQQDNGLFGLGIQPVDLFPTAAVGQQAFQAAAQGVTAGIQEFQRTGDFTKALTAAQRGSAQSLEGSRPVQTLSRIGYNAVAGLVQEVSDAAQETFGGKATTAQNKNLPLFGMLPPLAKAKSSGPAEDLLTNITQAALAWVPAARGVNLAARGLKLLPGATAVGNTAGTALNALKATKAAQAVAKVPGAAAVGRAVASNTVTKAAATGAVVDYTAFDQHEGRLVDLVDQLQQTVTGTPLEGPLVDYLKSDPRDVGATGRLKNVLEGALIGTGLEVALRTFRAARSAVQARNAAPEAKAEALQQLQQDSDALSLELVRQASSTPDAGPALSVDMPQAQPMPRPDMQPPQYSQVAEVNPQTIAVDPQRFQFKEAGRLTKSGASGSLAESSDFNDVLAGVISVWRDPADGQTYVVNGHNRLRLARESGASNVLVRYLSAETAEEARAIGALQNIAEGQGTPVDAAKFMRDTGKSAEDMAAEGINLSGPVASQAVPLSRLPQNLFDRVATGKLDLAKAAALGSEALDPQIINDVATEATKRKWSADKILQAMQEAKFAQTQATGDDLLSLLGGEWASKTSNFNQLLDVRTEAFKSLREEMVALTSAAREGRRGILEAAGNVIDVAGSQAARGQAAQAVEVFNRVTGYVGPVRDLLNEMAGQVSGKRTAKLVVGENLDRLRQAIDDEINGPRPPLDEPPAAAAPEPSVPSAGSSAAFTPQQASETRALFDRALATLPPEKRAALQAELEARAARGQALASEVDADGRTWVGVAEYKELPVEAQRALALEVIEDIRRVAGDDVAIRFNNAFELIQRPQAHGGGDKRILAGGMYDPIGDVISMNGWLYGTPASSKKQTAFHEAFHRVQYNFLTEKELKALNSMWSQLKLFVGDGSDRRTLIEQQAVAFQKYAYARKEGIDPIAYLAGADEQSLKGYKANEDGSTQSLTGMEKATQDIVVAGVNILDNLLDFIEKANNYLRGRGWTSVKSIFDQAYTGKLAETRGDLGNALDDYGSRAYILDEIKALKTVPLGDKTARGVLYSEVDPVPVAAPTPDERWAQQLVDQILANRQAIEDGDMTLDDLLQNNVLKVQSPSGATVYVPDAPPEMVEAYRAHSDLVNRVDATGIPVMSEERIAFDTAAWLEKSNYDSKAVLENLARISGPLSNYQENLVALRAAMLLADHNNYQAGIAANKWLNGAVDESADMGQLAAELVSAAAAADRANRAVESVTRPLGQLMRSTQIRRPLPGSLPFDTPSAGRNIAEELEEAMVKEADVPVSETIGRQVSPELEEAIRTGDFSSPKVAEELDALALNSAQGAVTPGYAQGFWSNLNKSLGVGANGLMMYRSSQLLSSGITFWGNVINSALRTVELPFTQAVGAMMQGAPVRASRSLMIYGQYVSNLLNAFRMGVESFKVGRGLFDLNREQADFLDRLAQQDAQGELVASPQQGEWDLNTMPWVAIQDKSNWAVAQKRIWQGLNLSTRLQVSADSAFKTLVGQSFEYVRNLQPGLDNAVRLGMDGNSKEAWKFATDYARAAVDRSMRDVTINGRTILDGVMESPHAQTAMRWATFTDDIWAQMQPRTMSYGMKVAEAKGLKDVDAQKFAQDYVVNGPRIFGKGMDDIPFFARTFSIMPKIWQTGLDSPMAPLFALIQPFNRTPGDIVKSVARKTPLAPLVDTWWRDVFSEDAMTRDRAVGDIAVGAAAIALASVAMTHGRVQFTGGGPINPEARRKWNEQEGKQPYSFRIRTGEDENGNPIYSDWVSMRAMDPFSSLLGGLADYHELANKVSVEARERLGGALVIDLVAAVAAGQLQKSYYTGFSEFAQMVLGLGELDTAPNKRHPTARYVERLVASFVPYSSALRAGRRIEDPTAREVPASDSPNLVMRLFEETLNEIRNAVPGWSESLPPKRNWITGEPIVLSGIWGDQFLPPESPWLSALIQYSPASPFQLRGEPGEMVLREMGQLTGRGAGFVGPRPTDFTDGGKVKANRLAPDEYEQYVLAISRTPDQFGRTLVQALEEEIKSDLYQQNPQGAPSEQVTSLRAAALNTVITDFMKLGREAFLSSPAGKRLMDNKDWAEGANRDVQFRLKYGQEIDPAAFVEALR